MVYVCIIDTRNPKSLLYSSNFFIILGFTDVHFPTGLTFDTSTIPNKLERYLYNTYVFIENFLDFKTTDNENLFLSMHVPSSGNREPVFLWQGENTYEYQSAALCEHAAY